MESKLIAALTYNLATLATCRGLPSKVESNGYEKTVDYPDEWANGYHVMIDSDELVRCGGTRWSDYKDAVVNRAIPSESVGSFRGRRSDVSTKFFPPSPMPLYIPFRNANVFAAAPLNCHLTLSNTHSTIVTGPVPAYTRTQFLNLHFSKVELSRST
jgi:hypothetical protein